MRILLDYRPALRERTGVGEYVHELARALARTPAGDVISLFSTSWKDRPSPDLQTELPGVRVIDHRVPVRGLTWAWNRLQWPPVEWLGADADVVHAQTPLLIPSLRAAQVVTIHDLDFLHHPDRTQAEMRRDYPELVREHALRADHVIVSSHYAAREVVTHLEVPPEKLSVCSPGAPEWAHRIALERAEAPSAPSSTGGTRDTHAPLILFVGTLEPRKNIGVLLDAYATLRHRRAAAPPLVLAGRVQPSVSQELARTKDSVFAGQVTATGYVSDHVRQDLYRQACMVVLPSLEEGFGLPVLEAMAAGIPVVVSNRGALPEVVGDAAAPVEPTDVDALASAMERLLHPEVAREAAARGLAQAARYSWDACAAAARDAYRAAMAARERRIR